MPGAYLLQIPWELDAIGGVSQVVRNLAISLQRANTRAPVLIPDWSAATPQHSKLPSAGIELIRYRLRPPIVRGHALRSLSTYLASAPAAVAHLRSLIANLELRTVNVHYPGDNAWNWAALKRMGVLRAPLLLSFHGQDIVGIEQSQGAQRWLWRNLLESADALVFCSESLRERLHRCLPVRTRTAVIYNGCDPDALRTESQSHRSPLEIADGRSYLVSLGTFEDKKGHDLLIRAFASIAPRQPTLDIVIAGRSADPEYMRSLHALIDESSLRGRVHLLTDIAHGPAMALLKKAAMLVIASRVEPFGIVALEAAALGRPVIASAASGVCEAVPRDALVTFETGNAVHLARTLEQVLEANYPAAQVAAALRDYVDANLTWARATERYLSLANEASARRSMLR